MNIPRLLLCCLLACTAASGQDAGQSTQPVLDPFAGIIERDKITPGPDGVVALTVDQAVLQKIGTRTLNEGKVATSDWNNSDSTLEWEFYLPAAGQYRVELTWTAGPPGGPVTITLNERSIVKQELDHTGNWDNFRSETLTTLTVPGGKSRMVLTAPKAAENKKFDILCVRLLPTSLDASIRELNQKNRLGMSRAELEQLWGISVKANKFVMNTKGALNDTDWFLFDGVDNWITFVIWYKKDAVIKAALLDDTCIGLEFLIPDKSIAAAAQLAQAMLPGVRFAIDRRDLGRRTIVAYSTDPEKSYKLHVRNDGYFDIKASAIVRKSGKAGVNPALPFHKRDLDLLTATLSNNLRTAGQDDSSRRSLIGMTGEQMRQLLGPEAWKRPWGNLSALEWRFGAIELLAAFKDGEHCDRVVLLCKQNIQPSQVLQLAEFLLPGLRFNAGDSEGKDLRQRFRISELTSQGNITATWSFEWNRYILSIESSTYQRPADQQPPRPADVRKTPQERINAIKSFL